ncbi:phage baseplate protein [Photorhabdus laumondii subsp. laumondii]|uniref:Photorhabdus luminescens subsp. laumondii TTO1 complete genome segment 9/17 n=2 Tax=Photorhabdus laumondii subsp. laumondii TaxID=141679 RepID=Q7MB30_PHOLL|nr:MULTISPECIES: GPW/gp25 family protein [Photorhabdus]AWK42269.1 phage baseplate protein [Photorhabdus laumondii subsp. laumondii]AXG43118.1 phage baseplate protein [Photorhabdus laumondii subsp. laumondii]AXG47589.1 phage baseplate protein [Photorhabdus laumondii subsp. laumondii]KTL62874.1 phage baseplate protein [Photorhabdus laumondii subsp. laumondii]MCC8384787.1 GPW/gp25 family protein [Photorhabdus laumondii]
MADKILADIYGRGWAFPPQFSSQTGVIMAEGAEHVRQSMKVLFLTEPGERIMREDYGCGLHDYLFENITDELMARIQTRIEERILRYEPRVEMTEIQVNQKINLPNSLHIQVSYALRGSEISQQVEGIIKLGEGEVIL